MTSKLKCPFCGAELVGREDAYGNVSDVWLECPNDEVCDHAYPAMRFDIWQALIDGKAAQDALKEIKETVDAFKDSEFAEDMRDCVRTISQILASIPTEKDK